MNDAWGVIWDLDGVLADTGEYHFQSWVAALDREGIPFSYELFRKTFGMNNTGILKMLLGSGYTPERAQKIADYKEEYFRDDIRGKVELLPGVQHWLDWLSVHTVPQIVASSAPQANVDALAQELGIEKYFVALLSGSLLPGKPDPAVFLLAAQTIQISPPRCLVIEDAIAGVAAAKSAGMTCLAVTTSNPKEALQQADLVVERLNLIEPEALERLMQTA